MADRPVILRDPVSGERLFPATLSSMIYNEDGTKFDPSSIPTGSGSNVMVFDAIITTNWTEDSETGVKTQLVPVAGMTADHDVNAFDVVNTHERTSEGYAAFVEEQNQFLEYITNGDAETVDGGIMIYVYGDVPTIEIPVAGTAVIQ